MTRRVRLSVLAAMLASVLAAPAGASALSCLSSHWVGAWQSPPSSGAGTLSLNLNGLFDSSLNLITAADRETIRSVLTPSIGGSQVRIHLSNRFGYAPVTFGTVTIALAGSAGSTASQPVPITFNGGRYSVTLNPGQDVVSDPVSFSYNAMQSLAVSMFVANDAGIPSTHYTAQQTSYLSGAGSGDHTGERSGAAFTERTTTRPYLDGLDVVAPGSTGAVIALGDSLTDGYQPGPTALTESTSMIDTDRRYTDDLARRLIAAAIPLSVLNSGISGNMVQGANPGPGVIDGPPALNRLSTDVLDVAGATTVIWEEGLNDIGVTGASAATLEAAYTRGIAEMHAAGLRVLLGTLTPTGNAALEATRTQVNAWIRTNSPADGVIDFDAALRNPSDAGRISPPYNGGDNLHFDVAGYQAMANAVNLAALRVPTCTQLGLKLTVNPTKAQAGKQVTLHFTVAIKDLGHRIPAPSGVVTVAGHHTAVHSGRASITLRITRSGRYRVKAAVTGFRSTTGTLVVTAPAPRHKQRGHQRTKRTKASG